MANKVLVTGGLGYIGSHTVVELINQGYEPLIIDNLSNSDISVLERLEKITGKRPEFQQVEMRDKEQLQEVFWSNNNQIKGVIHFAAALLVGESVEQPLHYYFNNLTSTINLLECMNEFDVKPLVFSSSCTVYGNPDQLPVSEKAPIKPAISPYGNTKKVCEDILKDASIAHPIKVVSLRYFNPIGAHKSSEIGEFQSGPPHHLVPYITETASGKRERLNIFGGDWNTSDGTCVRDYIHVSDVAEAHINAMEYAIEQLDNSFNVFNIGTGNGYSVLEMVKSFEKTTGVKVPYEIVDRRPGDVEAVYADTSKANNELGFSTKRGLDEMLKSAWDWEQALIK
ncbi:UDP-glucose 4-epimerase [Marivirga tractuosa]|uniref:UDP-glucose 4-epimerase n=1 Tax=Marivirga tractuosa (strain ATCC 23168 / DSM 4126 / NBRC 15989 / NCIMB 1408 / VKM B-1430 / H-43) TaxID=643867 RepID=E4TNL6_MARTH|nr:UDP-glucose 4-epimerase GalE [Marivirga tractuosa]ADR21453.1 UDP-galactose 4-epimerase [Marivirga tractuosa DSM 4126]BDD14093.1 UDP-glucose 4-epimerase [Marivirga tractuosa]